MFLGDRSSNEIGVVVSASPSLISQLRSDIAIERSKFSTDAGDMGEQSRIQSLVAPRR